MKILGAIAVQCAGNIHRCVAEQMSAVNAERFHRVLQLQRAADGPQDAETLRSGIVLLRAVGRKLLSTHVQIQ